MKKTAADNVRYAALMKYLQRRLEDDIATPPSIYQSHRLFRVDPKIDCEAVLCVNPFWGQNLGSARLSVKTSGCFTVAITET